MDAKWTVLLVLIALALVGAAGVATYLMLRKPGGGSPGSMGEDEGGPPGLPEDPEDPEDPESPSDARLYANVRHVIRGATGLAFTTVTDRFREAYADAATQALRLQFDATATVNPSDVAHVSFQNFTFVGGLECVLVRATVTIPEATAQAAVDFGLGEQEAANAMSLAVANEASGRTVGIGQVGYQLKDSDDFGFAPMPGSVGGGGNFFANGGGGAFTYAPGDGGLVPPPMREGEPALEYEYGLTIQDQIVAHGVLDGDQDFAETARAALFDLLVAEGVVEGGSPEAVVVTSVDEAPQGIYSVQDSPNNPQLVVQASGVIDDGARVFVLVRSYDRQSVADASIQDGRLFGEIPIDEVPLDASA